MMLEKALSSRTGIRLLRIFHSFPGRAFSLSDITRITGQSTGAVYPALKRLVDSGMIRYSKVGKSAAYRLNAENLLVRKVMEIFSAETEMLKNAARMFAKNVEKGGILSIILFGSVARGEPRETSDVDLLIVFRGNRESVEKNVNRLVEEYLKSDVYLAPVLYSEREIRDMYSHYNSFILKVEEEGVLLYGKPLRRIRYERD